MANLTLLQPDATEEQIAEKVATFKWICRAKARSLWKMENVPIGPFHKVEFIKAVIALDIPVTELIHDINLLLITRKANLNEALEIAKGFIQLFIHLVPKAGGLIPANVLDNLTANVSDKVEQMYQDVPTAPEDIDV